MMWRMTERYFSPHLHTKGPSYADAPLVSCVAVFSPSEGLVRWPRSTPALPVSLRPAPWGREFVCRPVGFTIRRPGRPLDWCLKSPLLEVCDISTSTALSRYLDVINFFCADPLPRLSIQLAATWTLVLGSGRTSSTDSVRAEQHRECLQRRDEKRRLARLLIHPRPAFPLQLQTEPPRRPQVQRAVQRGLTEASLRFLFALPTPVHLLSGAADDGKVPTTNGW